MMSKQLYDYELDENLDLHLLIQSCQLRTAKNGKHFLALTFQDKSGKMDGKFWDAAEEDGERFKSGTIVRLTGKRELYQGQDQLKIFSMYPVNDPLDPADFMESAPLDKDQMIKEFTGFIEKIDRPAINAVVRHVLNTHQAKFFSGPAAKSLHHAFEGGLAFHTLSLLHLSQAVIDFYGRIGLSLNPSLLYGGAILHDLGKVRELSGAVGTEYTLEGNLIGHIVMANEEISKACQALEIDEDQEDILLLKHMVLAHHGHLEYGSPVRPQLLEAEILHALDDLDASITQVSAALDKTTSGNYSRRLFGMDNRAFYKSSSNSQPNE